MSIIIVIAHRLNSIAIAETIIVMTNASIVETGNHHDLLTQKGKYFELWKYAEFDIMFVK